MENQLIKHNVNLLWSRLSRVMRRSACSVPLRVVRLGLPCMALFAASGASAANLPALQVARVQGPVKVLRLGQQRTLHLGDRVVARDVVKLGKDARLSLSLAKRGKFQLAGAGKISIEQLPPVTAPVTKTATNPISAPVIVSLEQGDMHLLWYSANKAAASAKQAKPLYVYFARRRVELQPGEYFFHQQHGQTQICVAKGQAETMTIAAGKRRLVPAHDCESRQGRTTRILARNTATWPRMRQRFAFPDTKDAVGADGKSAKSQINSRVAESSQTPAVPASATAASKESNSSGAGWVVNVASYSTVDDARQQQQQLQAAGYHVVVVSAQVYGRTWYRVQVSGFSTPAAAHATAVALQTHLGYQQLWVLQHP